MVCDNCGKEDAEGGVVKAHELLIDGAGGQVDLCESCWKPARTKLEGILAVARGIRGKRKSLRAVS